MHTTCVLSAGELPGEIPVLWSPKGSDKYMYPPCDCMVSKVRKPWGIPTKRPRFVRVNYVSCKSNLSILDFVPALKKI